MYIVTVLLMSLTYFPIENREIVTIPSGDSTNFFIKEMFPGIKFEVSASGSLSPVSLLVAPRITQISFSLSNLAGATGVSSSSVWTTPTNATGIHNGSTADFVGNIAAPRDGTLSFQHIVSFPNKESLTLTSVLLNYYIMSEGTILNNGDLRLQDGPTILETITGNVDALTSPRSFERLSQYTTFASLTGIQPSVRGLTDIGESLTQYHVDAVELVLTASGI